MQHRSFLLLVEFADGAYRRLGFTTLERAERYRDRYLANGARGAVVIPTYL